VPIVRVVDDDLTTRMSEYAGWYALSHLLRTTPRAAARAQTTTTSGRHMSGSAWGSRTGQDAIAKLAVRFCCGWSRTPTAAAAGHVRGRRRP
jgi:hypothetical protein